MTALQAILPYPDHETPVTAVDYKPNYQPQVCFTRQLWQRTMSASDQDTVPSRMPRVSIGSNISLPSSRSATTRSASAASVMSNSLQSAFSPPLTPGGEGPAGGQRRASEARKRPATDDEGGSEQAASSSPPQRMDGAEFPCLCQPEPKIPRPRNAFILYRQHHNGAVIAKYPNLTNPEISKIIGEHWRAEPDEVKLRWRAFADEDKLQHAQKYPTYRYQPRRNNKGNQASEIFPGPWGDSVTCPKCHGRKTISVPPAPQTTGAPRDTSQTTEHDTLPRRSNTITLPPPRPSNIVTPSTRYLPIQNLSLDTPRSDHQPEHFPSPKRRRANPQQTPQGLDHPQHNRRISLPPASALIHASRNARQPHTGIHRTPPMASHPGLQARRAPTRADLSVQLPPLKTAIPAIPAGPATTSLATARFPQTPSRPTPLDVVRHKVTTLRQLLLPCPSAGKGRGAIVAVEGDSVAAARELADWLGETMGRVVSGGVAVVNGPRVPEGRVKVGALLNTVGEWHGRSDEVRRLAVGEGSSEARRKDSSSSSSSTAGRQGQGQAEQGKQTGSPGEDNDGRLVVMRGYVLTATNLFAARIPLTGNYDHKGHWEWTACMWRGVVAPDVIVYVQDVESRDEADAAGFEVLDDGRMMVVRRFVGEAAPAAAAAAADSTGGVEGVQPGALRRLGFEVGEWLRDFRG